MTSTAGGFLLQRVHEIMKNPADLSKQARKFQTADFHLICSWAKARYPHLDDKKIFSSAGDLVELRRIEETCKHCKGLDQCANVDAGVTMVGELVKGGTIHWATGYCHYKRADQKRKMAAKATGGEAYTPRASKWYKSANRFGG